MTKTDLEKSALIERAIYDRVWDRGNFREISGWYDDFYARMKSAENKLETDGNALAKHIVLLTNENIKLSKQIAEANKILDDAPITEVWSDRGKNEYPVLKEKKVKFQEFEDWRERLRVVLETEK